MKYFVILLSVVILLGTAYADSDDYRKFPLGDSYMYADNKHIADISLSWSESLPYGTITFDKKIDSDISIMIPKNIPRKMNLDFGTSMAVFYPDTSIEQIKEIETDCFYHLRIPVNNADKINIDTISVATGRWEPVKIDDLKCERIYKHYFETYELKSETSHSKISPLKQIQTGIPFNEIQCKQNLVLVQKYDGSPACVTESTKQKLIERGWTAKDSTVSVKGCDTKADFDLVRYSESSDKPPQRLVAFLKEGTTGFICLQYQSNLENKGFFDIDEDMYQRNSKTEISSEVTLNAKPNQVSLEYGTDIMVVYEIRASSNSTGVYWINLSQLCDSLPVVIWNDEPKVSESDIPVRTGVKHCPMKVLDVSITGYSGLDLKYHSAKPT